VGGAPLGFFYDNGDNTRHSFYILLGHTHSQCQTSAKATDLYNDLQKQI